MRTEDEDIFLLRNIEQHLSNCRQQENDARKMLAEAIGSTRRAKKRYEERFAECEKNAVKRKMQS